MALIEKLEAIGNAIRAKTGKTDKLSLEQMPVEIAGIEGGGIDPADLSVFDPTKETIIVRSTATQKDICVTKTAMAFVNTGKYAGYVGCKFNAVVGKTYEISWEKISSSEEFLFYYQSDAILTKVDDHYGTRIQHTNNPFLITATKPYIYLYIAHPAVPSNELVCILGLIVKEVG